MPGNDWLIAIETIRGALETDAKGTVFEQPRKVAKLPDALGGDPKQWPALGAVANFAVSKNSFFQLLREKAHFLMLPKPIVGVMKKLDRVSIVEEFSEGEADTELGEDSSGRFAKMNVPGVNEALPKFGYELGRTAEVPSGGYSVIGTLYHEMTHSWLWMRPDNDDIPKLYADGIAAYLKARDDKDGWVSPVLAFTEAAGYYVGDRVVRWCTALTKLDNLIRNTAREDPYTRALNLPDKLKKIVEDYDRYVPTYGVVYDKQGVGHRIGSPPLSDELRAAIDEKILEGRPLTKPFADTPLAGLRASLLSP